MPAFNFKLRHAGEVALWGTIAAENEHAAAELLLDRHAERVNFYNAENAKAHEQGEDIPYVVIPPEDLDVEVTPRG